MEQAGLEQAGLEQAAKPVGHERAAQPEGQAGPAVGELDSRQQGRWPWDPKAVKQSRVPPALTSVFRTGTQAPFSRALEMRTKGSLLLQVSLLSSLTPASASVT